MLLAVDIGNSNIVIGVFKGGPLKRHWRVKTERERAADEYGTLLLNLLSSAGLSPEDIEGSIICSVVPSLSKTFTDSIVRYLGVEPRLVGEDISAGIKVVTDNPEEVGADRLVNAVAARNLHKPPLIVADLGTAITVDYITEKGFMGGAIAPGILISAEALFQRTSKLPRVDVSRPPRVVGRNTGESIRAGVFFGFVGLVDGLIERMISEVGGRPRIIATGGMSRLVAGESRYIKKIEEFLTLKGFKLIYEGTL